MMTMPPSTMDAGPTDGRALNRWIGWSLAVHITAVVLLFVLPRDWFRKPAPPAVMTITIGGTPGPRSTGTNSMGGRTVEQVAPPPRRSEPIRPTPREEPAPVPVRTPPRTETVKLTPTPARPAPPPPARAPVTGTQVAQGSTRVDTGAISQGTGLTFGGEGTGGVTDLSDFCCPEYLRHLLNTISSKWQKNQPERRGTTTLKFTIRRDGSIDLPNILVETSAGNALLDRVAIRALHEANPSLLRLPPQYPEPVLTIHLNFPYGPG